MKNSIRLSVLVFVSLIILLSGCVPASTPVSPTLTPIPPTETSVPSTSTPVPSDTPASTVGTSTTITTSVGDVVVTKAEIVNEDMFGSKAAPGYQILYVWFESADGSEIDGGDFLDASKGVAYVIGDDGSTTERYLGGLMSGSLMLGFTAPVSAKEFTLYWGDNDPITLSLS
jgi:hypothetical protein